MQHLVAAALANRKTTLTACLLAVALALYLARTLRFDALPDITTNQVLVLTRAPGLTPEEVERLVTRRIETALGGSPGMVGQRSISRYGICAVTAVFEDGVDAYRARQIVQERLLLVQNDLPPGVEAPELGPLTGGLGEIYHFAVQSPTRSPTELLELVQLQIAPHLRAVPGVVEVNTWGGRQRAYEVAARVADLARHGMTLGELAEAVRQGIGAVPGAAVAAGAGQTLLRAVAWPQSAADLRQLVVHRSPSGAVVRLGDVADLRDGARVSLGAATLNGQGQVVYAMVQMLRDDNARQVMAGIHEAMQKILPTLPPDIRVALIYDRSELVNRTLATVGMNLAEGAALVCLVLVLLLGSWRASLLVGLLIPLSAAGAAAAMALGGVAGNLMSLGALDFGLLVDGAVVMVEGMLHAAQARQPEMPRIHAMRQAALSLGRPVFYAVLVIVLVYVPILSLRGVDGKLFAPMALTVIFALLASLVLALTFVPAATALFVRDADVPAEPPLLVRWANRLYRPLLGAAMARPWAVVAAALGLLGVGAAALLQLGSAFVPQLDEGDLVLQSTRNADISLQGATDAALRLETVLKAVPEVAQVSSRVGSPAVATDIMGYEQADVFIALKPKDQWRPHLSRDQLIEQIEALVKHADPHNDFALTQPIQMRFNELIGGSVTDLDISVYGEDLRAARATAEKIAAAVAKVAGADDVRILAPPAVSLVDVRPKPLAAAQLGLNAREVLTAVGAAKMGEPLAVVYQGPVRVPVLLRLSDPPSAFDVAKLQLPTPGGTLVALDQVADVVRQDTLGAVQRQGGQRRLIVGLNVRGAELGDVVAAAQAKVAALGALPAGQWLHWGGQFASMQAARARLQVVVPVTVLAIFLLLLVTFRRAGPALLVLLNVPFAAVGGVLLLWARQMPLSMSAIVGMVALSGIAVLNGVVWCSTWLEHRDQGAEPLQALHRAATQRLRPVLMTALSAAAGFVPMMVATGAGAEVQRPLATVVVGGLATSTALTLLVLPAVLAAVGRRRG